MTKFGREQADEVIRDPNFQLRVALARLAETENPYYAWRAIKVCIKHKKEFPDRLLTYLEDCADRMLSDRTREARNLHKVLPGIFGFSPKHGPGNLLDPDRTIPVDRDQFALRFAIRLEQGEPPLEAMRNACNEVFDGEDFDADEKTLKRWLLKEFELKKWPTTADEWKNVAHKHYGSFFALLYDHWERTKSRETLS
jgi:hypothetical protein